MLRATALVLLSLSVGVLVSGCGDDSTGDAKAPPALAPPPGTTTPTTPGTSGKTVSAHPSELGGKTFQSVSVEGHELLPGTKVELTFQGGILTARAGCNSMGGKYTFEDGKLKQAQGGTTQMACGEGTAEQDQWLGDFVRGGVDATLTGDTLTLTDGDVTITLNETGPSGLPPVVGPEWTLESIVELSGSAASLPAGVKPPTLQLSEAGKAHIYTGCNQGNATAVFADGFVTFGPVATTRRACPPPAGEVEQTVLKVLDGKVAAGFDGENRLSLTKNGTSLIYTAGK